MGSTPQHPTFNHCYYRYHFLFKNLPILRSYSRNFC